jgi:hypothetical protein
LQPQIVFKPLDSRYSERTHLGVLSASGFTVDPFQMLKMGEEVIIKIEPDRAFTLYHLGAEPEKAVIENRKQLRVVMPSKCLLVFKYDNDEQKVRVFSSF